MARHDNSYSRLIAWLKVLLPLLALAILSTLFLVSSDRNADEDNLPYSQVELDRIVREQKMRNPNYAGITGDGAAITIAAESARPGASDGEITAASVIGAIETPDSGRIDLSARSGAINTSGREVALSGKVALRSSSGWRVESRAMTALLEETRVISPGPVSATGPAGKLDAGAMDLGLEEGRYLLRFTDGMKLLYDPADRQGEEK